ncbi:MAG: VanZ family protein [Bacteroidales bacterium]|nr:VanZ family protein [Bacteroidales bacterium]
MTRNQKILFRVLFFLYVAAVLFLCFGKFDNTPDIPKTLLGIPIDKVVHFLMFFPFPILAFLAFDQFTDTIPATLAFTGITFVVGIALAIGTEWGQATLTDYRSGDHWDLLADTLSLTLSSLLVILWDIRKQRTSSK